MGPDDAPDFGVRLFHIGLVADLIRLSAIGDLDGMENLLDPAMRMLAAPGVAPARPYRTRADFLEYFAEARAAGVLVEPDAHEIRVTPAGAVVVAGRLRVTTAGEVDETPAWFVYTFRDRRIASLETYLSQELAHEAAGQAQPA